MVELTQSNFDQVKGTGLWFVMFFAPWCGHCKNALPHFSNSASELKGDVNFGTVDCTEHKDICS